MTISNNASALRPGVCTSITRPTNPYEGQIIYETDTDRVLVWNGSTWLYSSTPQSIEIGVWESFSPTLFSGTGQAAVSTATGRYCRINKTIVLHVYLQANGTGGAGIVECRGLPSAIAPLRTGGANNGSGSEVGTGTYLDAGSAQYIGACYWASSTAIRILISSSVDLSLTAASGDKMIFTLTYEAT
jgi:hypothetical protein